MLVADPGLCITLDNVAHHMQKVGQDRLYVHSVNIDYIRDNILGTYDCAYEDVFWDVMPCNLMDTYGRFRGTCCLYQQGTKESGFLKISVYFYQSTRRHFSECS